jgi:hypothetical protein
VDGYELPAWFCEQCETFIRGDDPTGVPLALLSRKLLTALRQHERTYGPADGDLILAALRDLRQALGLP